jgi:hypothetical protein
VSCALSDFLNGLFLVLLRSPHLTLSCLLGSSRGRADQDQFMANRNTRGTHVLPHVAEFVNLVRSRLESSIATDKIGIWFSRRDEGSLFLDRLERAKYSEVVTALLRQFAPIEWLDRKLLR